MSLLRLESEGFISLAEEVLSKGDALRFQASGISMHPFIRNGDILDIKPKGVQPLELWDIVLCKIPGGMLAAHRIVAVELVEGQKKFLIQGDGLVFPDGYIDPENVLGKVVGIIHNGTYHRLDTIRMKWAARTWIIFAQTIRKFKWHGSRIKQFLLSKR